MENHPNMALRLRRRATARLLTTALLVGVALAAALLAKAQPASAGKVDQVVDVSVSKTAAPEPVGVDSDLTYTITLTNESGVTVWGIHLTDTLPDTVDFVSVDPAANCNPPDGGPVICTFSSGLEAGGSVTVTIVVTTTALGDIQNTATSDVFSVSGHPTQADGHSANNGATVESHVVEGHTAPAPLPPPPPPSPRGLYCSVPGDVLHGQPLAPGTFLNLLFGQKGPDPNTNSDFTGAVPAFYVQGIGATCDPPPVGFSLSTGVQVNGAGIPGGENSIYPYFTK